jgi:peptidoglycan/LPS O-acetylase OafA/YrhL
LNYRSDIDGLRTIAVMLVIFNHVGLTFFSGGFVGVDVFFVISGFLITSIIYPLIAANKFSFRWFISRRIKRLMPVLFFVLFISMLFFSSFMLPKDLVQFYQSIIWVIFYGANFFFWKEHGGYFDGGSAEVPLLHTWSLAIEEQYYFIWPLMLVIAFKFIHKRHILPLSIIICLITIYLSELGTELTIGAAYYLLPTRFFELLVGSCLAIAWPNIPVAKIMVQHILSLIGVVLIIVSAILLNEHSSFPGYNALYPVLGTALLIYTSKGFVNSILSTKPFVFTGNISYSLYLWHWPIIVYFNYKSIPLIPSTQALILISTYFISILSWKYIEQPIRHVKESSFTYVSKVFYIVPTICFLALVSIGIYFEGFKQRFDDDTIQMEVAVNTFSNELRGNCHSSLRQANALPSKNCVFGETDNYQKRAFLIGDSHANHLAPFVDNLARKEKVLVQDYTLDQCLPIAGLKWGSNSYKANQCLQRNNNAMVHIDEQKFDYVILAASWPTIETKRILLENSSVDRNKVRELFLVQFDQTISTILNSGAIPIVINNTPTLGGKSPKCPIKKKVFNENLDCSIGKAQNSLIDDVTSTLQVRYPKIISINLSELMCTEKGCSMSLDGMPIYRDDDHLNIIGAKLLSERYLKENNSPFN